MQIWKRKCKNLDCDNVIVYKTEKGLNKATKLVLNNKTDGLCRSCRTKLQFKLNPKLREQLSILRSKNTGWHHKEKSKQLISQKVSGKNNSRYGYKYSKEELILLSTYNKDKPLTIAHRKLISKKLIEYYELHPKSDKSKSTEKYLYYRKVIQITSRQPIHLLLNYKNRGRAGTSGAYHLDHKYSINQGFLNNIDPEIIGSMHNLEFIPWEDNTKKLDACSITIQELLIMLDK